MALRYIALRSAPDASWPERLEEALASADWLMCAESAGIDDDDEARKLVRPLRAVRPARSGASLRLDFGAAGLVWAQALSPEELERVREEHPGSKGELTFGVRLSLEGSSGVLGDVLCELLQAVAIGLTGEQGWVLTPSGKWWDCARGRWV